MEEHLNARYLEGAAVSRQCTPLQTQGAYATSAWPSANRYQHALPHSLIRPDEDLL